jgi:DNA primase
MSINIDIIDILNKYNISYRENSYSDEIDILCPFHDDHHFGNAKINKKTGLFNCFSCGKGGGIVRFVALLEGITDREAFLLLKGNNNYDLNTLQKKIDFYKREQIKKDNRNLSQRILYKILSNLPITPIDSTNYWLYICNCILSYNFSEEELLQIYNKFLHQK